MRRQLRDNLVALTSLVVALSALGYNTWRNERTERNRNVRVAGIELLGEIGSLQQIIFYAHYAEGDARGDPRMGWADVLTINDLATIMPAEVAQDAAELRTTWEANVETLAEDEASFRRIDGAIDALRQETLASLRALR
ncbi:MAG TPA: hypothetical protein VJL86_09520 [Steroidobacteraceae bacterium]|nr:hypothetical protein [Steroidobacteraceae bacterium]